MRSSHVLALQLLLLVMYVCVHLVDLVANHLRRIVLVLSFSDLRVAVRPHQVLDCPVVDIDIIGVSSVSFYHLWTSFTILFVLINVLVLDGSVRLALVTCE